MMIGSVPHRLTAATADLDPPLAALDVPAMHRNADELVRRAGGTPIRVASKSVRCRWVLENVLVREGLSGIMAYSLAEALWLVELGFSDVLVGYPTADRAALRRLAASEVALPEVTLMVDDVRQLDFHSEHAAGAAAPIRTPQDAAAFAEVARSYSVRLVGVMFYEAQIAGLPDSSSAVRFVKHRSATELSLRRTEVVMALRAAGGVTGFRQQWRNGQRRVVGVRPVGDGGDGRERLVHARIVRRISRVRHRPSDVLRVTGGAPSG
jgi:D-serine deaminase-like pyridoxal phosphate-dependent protein